jgi:hypothetical protein
MSEEKEKIYITAFGDVVPEGDEKEMAKAIENLQEFSNEFLQVPQPVHVVEDEDEETGKEIFLVVQDEWPLGKDGDGEEKGEFATAAEALEFVEKMNLKIAEEIRNDLSFMRAVEIPKGEEVDFKKDLREGRFPQDRSGFIILGRDFDTTVSWGAHGLEDHWLPLNEVEDALEQLLQNRPIHTECGVDMEWDGIEKTLTVSGHGRCEFGEVAGNLVVEDEVEAVAAKVTGTAEVRDEESSLVVGGKRIKPQSESESEGVKL